MAGSCVYLQLFQQCLAEEVPDSKLMEWLNAGVLKRVVVSKREEPLSLGFLAWMVLGRAILREVRLYWSYYIRKLFGPGGPR